MHAQLLAGFLAAASSLNAVPVAPGTAEVSFISAAPSADLPALRSFLESAGRHAPALRPTGIGTVIGALLKADVLDTTSLGAAGVNLSEPITFSITGRSSVLCFSTKGNEAGARIASSLAGLGAAVHAKHKGLALNGATTGKGWRAGYVSKGSRTCAASGGADAQVALRSAADALAGSGLAGSRAFRTATAGLTGSPLVFALTTSGSLGLVVTPSQKTLSLRGKLLSPLVSLERPKPTDPVSSFAASGLLVGRAGISRSSMEDPEGPVAMTVRFLLHAACPKCGRDLTDGVLMRLAPHLDGSIALLVSGIDPSSAGLPYSRYFLISHAYSLGLRDELQVEKTLRETLDAISRGGGAIEGVSAEGGPHWAISVGKRKVFVGLVGKTLYISNDQTSRSAALPSLGNTVGGSSRHALEVMLDAEELASALRRISILDAAKTQELAALFALAVEAGPLLRKVGKIAAFANPVKGGANLTVDLQVRD